MLPRTCLCLVLGIVVLISCICPVQAFTAKSLDVVVQENGDAIITFDYSLNLMENAAVFTRITDPSTELKKALAANYNRDVDVIGTSSSEAIVLVHGFAASSTDNGVVTMTTPALSFQSAERVLKQYWFAPLISVDFSPEITRVIFPDGYIAEYSNQIAIPRITHTLIR
jgi:hypothetical protein